MFWKKSKQNTPLNAARPWGIKVPTRKDSNISSTSFILPALNMFIVHKFLAGVATKNVVFFIDKQYNLIQAGKFSILGYPSTKICYLMVDSPGTSFENFDRVCFLYFVSSGLAITSHCLAIYQYQMSKRLYLLLNVYLKWKTFTLNSNIFE